MAQKNLKLVKRWVEALESGKYQQGKHRLKTGNQYGQYFCCLGVLREIEPKFSRAGAAFDVLDSYQFNEYINDILPAGCYLHQDELANMNDTGGTFLEIAQHIRKKVGLTKKPKKVKR